MSVKIQLDICPTHTLGHLVVSANILLFLYYWKLFPISLALCFTFMHLLTAYLFFSASGLNIVVSSFPYHVQSYFPPFPLHPQKLPQWRETPKNTPV